HACPSAASDSIQRGVPSSASAGQDLKYVFCVQNISAAPAHQVTVRSPVPTHATLVRAAPEPSSRDPELVWRLGTLQPGQCRRIELVVKPTGNGDIRTCARVVFEHGQCVTTRIARPALKLRKVGPTQALLYDSLTYQL